MDETTQHRTGDIEVGQVEWHCSEEDGQPDVGVLLRLDASQFLWAGEILKDDWEDAGPDAAALGSDRGWWAILYEEGGAKKTVLGRFVDEYTARDFIDKMAFILSQSLKTAA